MLGKMEYWKECVFRDGHKFLEVSWKKILMEGS